MGFSTNTGLYDRWTGNPSAEGKKGSAETETPGYGTALVFDRDTLKVNQTKKQQAYRLR